jgi:hypothetical protein
MTPSGVALRHHDLMAGRWFRVSSAWAALNAATTNAERCGIATYLGLGLRNSLMHVMEEQIDLCTNLNDLMRCAGIAFTLLQVSKMGNEGGIAAL